VHCLDDGGDILIGLLAEDHDDGRALLGVVLAEVAKGLAFLIAGDGLHVERSAGLLCWSGLEFVGNANRGDDHYTYDQCEQPCETNLHAETPHLRPETLELNSPN